MRPGIAAEVPRSPCIAIPEPGARFDRVFVHASVSGLRLNRAAAG